MMMKCTSTAKRMTGESRGYCGDQQHHQAHCHLKVDDDDDDDDADDDDDEEDEG